MFGSRKRTAAKRRRLARLCARLDALRIEGLEPAKAAGFLRADGLLDSAAVPIAGSEHPWADILRGSAPPEVVAYLAASEKSGLGAGVLGFLAKEFGDDAPPTASGWLVSAELVVMFLISAIFGAFVLPTYEATFRNFRVELPGLTQLMSHLYSPSEPFLYLFLVLILLALAWRHAPLLLGPLTAIGDRLALLLPVMGRELRQVNGDVLAGWLGHGGPAGGFFSGSILESAIVARRSGIATRALRRLSLAVGRGLSLVQAIQVSRDFDSGIAEVLATAADQPSDCGAALRARWRTALQLYATRRLKGVLFAQLSIGVVIALTVIAMYLPIFRIGSYF